jgi:hypothetical protein
MIEGGTRLEYLLLRVGGGIEKGSTFALPAQACLSLIAITDLTHFGTAILESPHLGATPC